MIHLADAKPGDEKAIAVLCAELDEYYGDAPQGSPAERAVQVSITLFGEQPVARALLAWDGPALTGFASYSLLWPAAGLSSSLYLKEIYVASAYRRTGIGRLLMDRLRSIAVELGCSRVEWTTDTSNADAQAFYEELGAKPLTSKIFYRIPIH